MKRKVPLLSTLVTLFLGIIYLISNKTKKRIKIPFDRDRACENVRPFSTLMRYVERFQKKFYDQSDEICFHKKNFPTSITYTRDAFIALINADKAENVHIDFGIKENGDLVLCIFPADKDGQIIATELVKGCPVCEDKQTTTEQEHKAGNQTMVMRAMRMDANAQGLDDGQRTP